MKEQRLHYFFLGSDTDWDGTQAADEEAEENMRDGDEYSEDWSASSGGGDDTSSDESLVVTSGSESDDMYVLHPQISSTQSRDEDLINTTTSAH